MKLISYPHMSLGSVFPKKVKYDDVMCEDVKREDEKLNFLKRFIF